MRRLVFLALLALADAMMPTLYLPLSSKHPHALKIDVRNITSEMLTAQVPVDADNNTQCREDSLWYRQQALVATPWALKMYDATTKLPDGLLTGNRVQMGNFDECLATHALDADGVGLFWGEYCLAGLSVTRLGPPPNGSFGDSFNNHLLAALEGRKVQWAVCLPSSCTHRDLEEHLRVRMPELLLPSGDDDAPYVVNATVLPSNCYRRRSLPLDEGDWAMILLLAAALALVLASTAFDVTHPGASRESLLLAFSVRQNVPALFAARAKGHMASVNGVKFLSMAWVMLFHKYAVMVDTPSVNNDVVLEGLKYDWTQMPLSNGGTMAVNSFFLISGLLLTNSFIRERVAGRPFSLFNFYVYRYIRLTPVYAVVVGFYATLLSRTGSGPLWNPVIGAERDNCRRHWWRNLIYINNYQPVTNELCVVQTWYLAADMQLYWLSPLVLWPLWRWPRAGRALLALLLLVPLGSSFWLTYTRSYPWADVRGLSAEVRNSFFPMLYASAYARAAPFLVGVALAWVLHLTKKSSSRLPVLVVLLCWVILGVVSWTITYAMYIYYKPDHQYSALEAACFQSLHPFGWGLIVAWLIFACERGYAGPVNAFLSWSWWQPLSRLTYTAYLVHMAVFMYDLGITRSPGHYTHYNVVHTVLGDLLLILVLATAASLAFEMPVLNIDRLLLKPKDPSQSNPAQSKEPQRLSVPSAMAPRPSLRSNGSAPSHCHVNVAFEDEQVTKM